MRLDNVVLFLVACAAAPIPALAAPVLDPANGHSYELVEVQTTWAAAQVGAQGLMLAGVPGHLATITSASENAFIIGTFASAQATYFAWLGGRDNNGDEVWLWEGGPESGSQFSQGASPTAPYNYANWGGIEPNHFAPGEDFLSMNLGSTFAGILPGQWGDSPNPNPSDPIHAYIVEYEPATGAVDGAAASDHLILSAGSPNPFTASTRIEYTLPVPRAARLAIYDVSGRCMRELSRPPESPGVHAFVWDGFDADGRPVPAGVYLDVLRVGSASQSRKVMVIR